MLTRPNKTPVLRATHGLTTGGYKHAKTQGGQGRGREGRDVPNRIFMFLINPPSGNVGIQKLIAKHIFACFEKRKGEDSKSKYSRT